MQKYEGQLKSESFNLETKTSHKKGKDGKYRQEKFCNDIFTFDIEVTSAWLENGEIIGYRAGETADYWNSLQPLALPYIWQFSFNDTVYYGREFKDFLKVLKDMPKDRQCVIWVHNLSYEFHFLVDMLTVQSVFARSPHKPMKCVFKEYPNIEFRCSYMLTRLSLASWGEQIGLPKMIGDLDYEVLRTPYTELTEAELGYCERDCQVVYEGIKQYRERYGTIRDIPLTQTGTVRREVKERTTCDEAYVQKLKTLIPQSVDEYAMLQAIFAGGYTHANRMYSGKTIRGVIQHYDYSSSYPTVMCCERYPLTPWRQISLQSFPADKWYVDRAYIVNVTFKGIQCTTYNTYIQSSKCTGSGFVFDNGRVIKADELTIWLTEQDWLTIRDTYTWDSYEIHEAYRSFKEYLPKPIIEYILELYGNKTRLKWAVSEAEKDLYIQSKSYINSLFGMCVTAICQSDVVLNEDTWAVMPLTREAIEKKLESLRSYNPREKRYFLSYSWGCWITAYARRNLWRCIISIDRAVIYADTDSIFCRGEHNFSWYDEEVTEKLHTACVALGIDFEKTRPKTKKGVAKPLGVFTREDDCTEFRTLGAKRYVERREDGKLHLTVSGINKQAVLLLNDDIDSFCDGFDFNMDSMRDGKTYTYTEGGVEHLAVQKRMHTYITDMPDLTWSDGYHSTIKHGINMRRTGYNLTMTDEYKKLIEYAGLTAEELPEHTFQVARGLVPPRDRRDNGKD